MKLYIIAIGKRMPRWIQEGYQIYADRLTQGMQLELKAINSVRRSQKEPAHAVMEREGRALLSAIPHQSDVIALDEKGMSRATCMLAHDLKIWQETARTVSFLIGGPDGLSQACLSRANARWSLSNLTLPHPLVRIILAEQLYRAWTILTHHPYHRD